MRWMTKGWRTAAGRTRTPATINTLEPNEADVLGLTEEQLLSRYQRASRLTC